MLKQLEANYLESCRHALSSLQSKSLAETNNWAHVDKAQVHLDWEVLYKEIAQEIDNLAPDSERAQEFIARHCAIASRFYLAQKDAYIGLALFYEENSDMKAYHNAYHPEMVRFLGDAISVYANAKL